MLENKEFGKRKSSLDLGVGRNQPSTRGFKIQWSGSDEDEMDKNTYPFLQYFYPSEQEIRHYESLPNSPPNSFNPIT